MTRSPRKTHGSQRRSTSNSSARLTRARDWISFHLLNRRHRYRAIERNAGGRRFSAGGATSRSSSRSSRANPTRQSASIRTAGCVRSPPDLLPVVSPSLRQTATRYGWLPSNATARVSARVPCRLDRPPGKPEPRVDGSGQEKSLPSARRVVIHPMIFTLPDRYRLCSTVSTDATFSAERGSAQASGPTHQHAERSARI